MLTQCDPDVLVLYEDSFNFLSKMCLEHVRQASFEMIEMGRRRGKTIIVNSSDASDFPEVYLERGADFIIRGEGEVPLAELCLWLKKKDREAIPPNGLIYMSNLGIRKTGPTIPMADLSRLPQPDWRQIDFSAYRRVWYKNHGYFSLNMSASRGCPYQCAWCAKPIWGRQYAAHSPEFVVDQMGWLHRHARPDHLWFTDDIFGLEKGWLQSFVTLLREKNIKIPFTIQTRADQVDRRCATLLREAGCDEVWLGVESGSARILSLMEKGADMEDVFNASRHLRDNGLKIGFFLQLGYPGEDIEDLSKTRALVKQMLPDKIGVSVSYPLPGTKFHDAVKNQAGDKTHLAHSSDIDIFFRSTFTREIYEAVKTHLHKEHAALLGDKGAGPEAGADWDARWDKLMAAADQNRAKDRRQGRSEV